MAYSHDVVVAGAGPAGSLAALVLARKGYRVALIERTRFPRPKVCGNCLNPRTWALWEELGLTESFSALPHQDFTGFTLNTEGRVLFRQPFSQPREGPRGVARDVFDDWLRHHAEASGAEFFPETAVTSVESRTGRVETSRGEFSAQVILGADGRNSVIARQSGLMPPARRCHRVAWQASVPAPAELDEDVHMHLFEEGYFGLCRYSPTHAVISLVLDARRTQDPLELTRRYFPAFAESEWLRLSPITRSPAQTGRDRVLAGRRCGARGGNPSLARA